jgi:hypothetical protein
LEQGEGLMNGVVDIDNRDPAHMYEYLEARIDVLKRRISELEEENQLLRMQNMHESHGSASMAGTFAKVQPFMRQRKRTLNTLTSRIT